MRKDKNPKGLLRQTGVTLIEMAVVVTVAGVLAIAGLRSAEYLSRSNAAENIANQARIGYDVLNNYAAQNVDRLVNGQPVPGVAVALAPTPAELVALGYRNFSVGSTIPGAQWTYSLARTPTGCTPNTCNITVYFGLTAPPRSRDNAPDIALIADAANRTSRPAGWSTNQAPGNIVGIGSQFNIANPQGPTPGILGLYGSYGAGQFGNYVRMGDTRAVSLNNTLGVGGAVTAGGNITTGATVQGGYVYSTGNVTAANAVTTPGTVQGGYVYSTGNVTAANAVTTPGTVQGGYVYSTGNVTAANAVTTPGTVQGGAVNSTGNMNAAGNITANAVTANFLGSNGDIHSSNGNIVTWNGAHYSFGNSWAYLAYAPGWNGNVEPQNPRGSMYVNDIYIRSKGRWASQGSAGGACYWTERYNLWGGGAGFCADGYYMRGWLGPYYHLDTNIGQFLCCQL